MKNMKLRKIICLLLVTCSSCSFFAGCTDDINNYEKQTAAEASNKVFISDKYASLAFNAQRTVEGKVANMDTLVAKLVVNCTSPAGGNLTVKVTIDTLLVDVYNKKNETSYHRFASNWIRLNKSTLTMPNLLLPLPNPTMRLSIMQLKITGCFMPTYRVAMQWLEK